MFWNNYCKLCSNKGLSPNAAAKEIGISSGSVTEWKKGRAPHIGTLKKIADYFGVPVAALTEDTAEQLSAPEKKLSPFATTPINEKESRVLFAYRSQPEMQSAVDKLLGISDDGSTVTLYAAAKSTENRKPEITQMPKSKWEDIETAPETEDDLL